jgi:hypothetical protein
VTKLRTRCPPPPRLPSPSPPAARRRLGLEKAHRGLLLEKSRSVETE